MSTKTVRIDAAVMDRVRAHCPQYLSLTQFCNLILDQELRRRIDNLTLSPLTIPPYPPTQKQSSRVESGDEGVENDERQRGVLEGGEEAREGIRLEEINRPLTGDDQSPNRTQISRDFKPAADHPWRTDDLNIGRNVIPEKLRDFDQQIRDFWKVKKGSKNKTAWTRQMTQLIAILDKYGPRVLGEQLDEGALKGTWQAITLKQYEQWGTGKPGAIEEPQTAHPASKVFKASDLDWLEPAHPLMEALTSESPF